MTSRGRTRTAGPPTGRPGVVAGALALLAVVLVVRTGWGRVPPGAALLLAGAVAASESAAVRLGVGGRCWTLSLTGALVAACLVVVSGAWVVVGVALGVAVAGAVRGRPPVRTLHDASQLALATAAAAAVATGAGAGVPGAAAGVGVLIALDHVLSVARSGRRPRWALLLSATPLWAAGFSLVGLLAGHLAHTSPVGLLGLVVPLGLVWSSAAQQTRQAGELGLLRELARGRAQALGTSLDSSARVVLSAAARVLVAPDVDLVVLGGNGPTHYRGDGVSVSETRPLLAEVLDEPWVASLLGRRAVAAGVESGRPWLTVALGPDAAPLALLRARRRMGAPAFGRPDTRLTRVLADQAQGWLSVDDRSVRRADAAKALGDVGAHTAPALGQLRDSADRLTRLSVQDGDLDAVVLELHQVERAVASLLGAVALAVEPDLLVPTRRDDPPPPGRSAAEWTTTGTLP